MNLALALFSLIGSADALLGQWRYEGYIYDSHYYPLPSPGLELFFTFRNDGYSNLKWSRQGEVGFCEREALYFIEGDNLHQEVTWVNPNNNYECQKDMDMQLGRQTVDPFKINNSHLFLFFNLNEKEFIYVLKKQTHLKETIQ